MRAESLFSVGQCVWLVLLRLLGFQEYNNIIALSSLLDIRE